MILQPTDKNTHLNYTRLIDFCPFTLLKAKHINGGKELR